MFTLARFRMMEGLKDAKFIFLCTLIVVAFLFNGMVYSEKYRLEWSNYQDGVADNTEGLDAASSSLMSVAAFNQNVLMPPSPLSFVADGGSRMLPNAVVVNAFARFDLLHLHRGNYKLPLLIAVDWTFIIGGLMTLLAIVVSFGAVSGEKRSGTLRLALSNPLSRLSLFLGNYFGLLAVIIVALLLGAIVNLVTIEVMGGPPLNEETLTTLGWAFVLAVLCLSAFLLAGLAASAMTGRPAVALVVLLVIWVLAVVATPGVARLLSEQMVEIPSQQFVREEQTRVGEEIRDSYPPIIGRFTGNPFEEGMPLRAESTSRVTQARQRIRDEADAAQVRQVSLAQGIASVSPFGLLSDGLQTLSSTGIHGVEQLTRNAERYRRQLHNFVIDRDRQDPESAHLVYGDGRGVERNTFSMRETPLEIIPRAGALWTASGLSRDRPWPLWQMVWLLAYNLLAGLIAFVALIRYDPR